jgi:ketosteroid isomerase-like protein
MDHPTSIDAPERTLPARLERAVEGWMEGFADAVRAVDYEAGRRYFDEYVVSCGTRTDLMVGRDQLEEHQWRGVWPWTRDFVFTRWWVADWAVTDTGDAWVLLVTEWTSQARGDVGSARRRDGRATLGLRGRAPRAAGSPEALRCVHSHFSLKPTEWRVDP